MNSKMIFFAFYLLITHCMFEIFQKKNTRVRYLNERVIFAYFIVLIILFLSIYDCFDFDRFFTSFCLFCRFVNLYDISVIHLTSILMFQVVWIRKFVDIELKNESTKRKKMNWNRNFAKHKIKKYQEKNIVDNSFSIKKKHCFSEIFKIIVAKTSSWKEKIMSRFQRKLSDNNFTNLNFCQM